MPRPRAVLFDMDGVLVDSFEIWVRVLPRVAEELGCPKITRSMVEDTWGQSVEADLERFYPGSDRATVTALYDRFLLEHAEHVSVIDGAPEVLSVLRERGVPHAVVTNSPRALALRMLTGANLGVPLLVAGDDVERGKPEPDMLQAACASLGVPTTEALMVGDTEYDRVAARAAGSAFAGYLLDGADRIDDLREVHRLTAETRS